MGCGGSKDDVAAGNPVAAKSMQPVDSAASEKKEAAAGALISKESPDRYFSSRKDEEAIAGGNVLDKDDDQLLADYVSVLEDSSEVKSEGLIVSDGEEKGIVEGPKSRDEKMSSGGGKKSEEASIEEKGTVEIIAGKKNYK